MTAATSLFTIRFPEGYDARMAHETPSRGYLSNVIVQIDSGKCYELFFVDPVRLQQELAENAESGDAYFAEPNLIVLPRVTTDTIRSAVASLQKDGYFERVKPM
jgi:hypothetical protein